MDSPEYIKPCFFYELYNNKTRRIYMKQSHRTRRDSAPTPQNDWDKACLVGLHAQGPSITTIFVWYYTTWQYAHKTLISGARVSVSRWRDKHIGLNIKLLKARDLWEDICVICVIPARRHCCFLASLTGQSSRLAVRTAQKTPTEWMFTYSLLGALRIDRRRSSACHWERNNKDAQYICDAFGLFV